MITDVELSGDIVAQRVCPIGGYRRLSGIPGNDKD